MIIGSTLRCSTDNHNGNSRMATRTDILSAICNTPCWWNYRCCRNNMRSQTQRMILEIDMCMELGDWFTFIFILYAPFHHELLEVI